MMIIIMGIVMIMMGYMFLAITYAIPVLRVIYLDWIGSFFFIIPFIIAMYRMWVAETYTQTERIPRWKQLVAYLRRDNRIVSLVGERAFAGESFIDIPNLGLMEFLGKDCVYQWGDKKVIWGLENVNFSPDPRYGNLCNCMWRLGFSNSDEVKQVLNGENAELRTKVYNNILEWEGPVDRLTNDLKNYTGKIVYFEPTKEKEINEAEKFIDNWNKK